MQTKPAAILIAIAGFAASSSGGPVSWWQPANGLWSDELRWNTQHIPGADDDVTFPTGPAIALIIQPAFARNLTLAASTNVQIAGSMTLTVKEELSGAGVLHVNTDSAPYNTALAGGTDRFKFRIRNAEVKLGARNNALLDQATVRINPGATGINSNAFVHGSGNLYSNWTNDGTISADVPGYILQFVDATHSNGGTMSAVSGILNFGGTGTLSQTATGTVLADAGGTVNLGNTSVADGIIKANAASRINIGSTASVEIRAKIDSTGGGLITFNGPVKAFSCTFNVGAAGFELAKGSQLTLLAVNLPGGTLTIRGNTAGPATILTLEGEVNIDGPTTLVLDAAGAGSENLAVITQRIPNYELDAGQTIRGAGAFAGTSRWVNNGLIQADVSNRRLIVGSVGITNNAVIKAISGGILDFTGVGVQQGASGRLIADAGSSLVLTNTQVTGGTVESLNGGSITLQQTNWTNVAPIGPVTVQSLFYTGSNLTNNSTITVLGSLVANGCTFGGTGTVFLKNVAPVLNGGSTPTPSTNGASHVIQGNGVLTGNWINEGLIIPSSTNGTFVGTISVTDKLTLAPSSRIEIETDTTFLDVIGTAAKSEIVLDGNVRFRISLWDFTKKDTSMDFMRGKSITGKFKTRTITFNSPPAGRAWRIYYQPTKTSLRVTCSADQDGDFLVDDTDFSYFVASYDLLDCADPAMPQTCPADLNKDGFVNDADFTLFVVVYNNLLCF